MRRVVLLPFFLAAASSCTESTPNVAHPPPKVSAVPSVALAPSAVPVPVVVDSGVAMPEGKTGWKTVPAAVNGFYPVLDGLCSKLGVGTVGSDLVVHYGGESIYSTERTGKASFIALRDKGLESIGDPVISSPTGIAGKSLEDFWIADSTGTRTSSGAVLHRRLAGTWKQYEKDQTNLHPWLDGGIIGTGGFAGTNGDVWVEGSTTKPPASLAYGYAPFPRLAAFPTGEVILFGRPANANGDEPKDAPWFVRHWSPTSKTVQHTLPMFRNSEWISIVEIAPDEVYAHSENVAAHYDGTAWKALAKPKGKIKRALRSAKGELWVFLESGAIERTNATASTTVVTPEPLEAVDGVDKGATWAVGKSGKVYKRSAAERREDETWTEVKIPGPTFGTAPVAKAKGVHVSSPTDVVVLASYWEKAPSWSEQELHHMLVRTKAPAETMRCNEPDPENNNVYIGRGFQSWPPFATAECKTPFVVLARRSKQKPAPSENDWKAIRGALKGQASLGDGKLVELVSGDRTFLGAKAKDLESAKKIVQLASAKDRLRAEIVCGEPTTTTREIALE